MDIQLLNKFGKHGIMNEVFIMFTRSIITILPILKGHNPVMHGWICLVFKRNRALTYIQLLYKLGKHRIINDDLNLFTRSIMAILPFLKGHNPVIHEQIWLVFERNRALMDIQLLNKFGKHGIINEDLIMFTRNCGQTTDKGRSQKLTLSLRDR